MCKIVVIPKVVDETREDAVKFVESIASIMSNVDKDGFGYAAISTEGKLYGERWLKNSEAFKSREPITEEERLLMEQYPNIFEKEEKYDSFGEVVDKESFTSITLHARMATSGKQFYNTHPFIEKDTSLIHNGVIVNSDKLINKYSTCDSEVILHEYIKSNVANSPKNIQKVVDKLDGYYACALFSKTKDGMVILDVFKDSRASLYGIFVKELNTIVVATDGDHIEKACKELYFTLGPKFEFKAGTMMRVDVATGKVIGTYKFDPYKVKRDQKDNYKKNKEKIKELLRQKKEYGSHTGKIEEKDLIGIEREMKLIPGLSNDKDWEYNEHSKVWKKVYRK